MFVVPEHRNHTTLLESPICFSINQTGDEETGIISILEKSSLFFEVKRVYWIHSVPNQMVRGEHAHKELQQLMVAMCGNIEVELETQTGNLSKYTLSTPATALFVPKMTWRRLFFPKGAILLCFCSHEYAEDDYIRDYNQFRNPAF